MVRHIVYSAISYVNEEHAGDLNAQLTTDDAPLLEGPLDSLALVDLLLDIERAFEREYGVESHLLGNPDVVAPDGPMRTVGTLIQYLSERAHERHTA